MLREPFKKKTEEELKADNAILTEIELQVEATINAGSECLNDPKFMNYKAQLRKAQDILEDYMFENIQVADPYEYAFIVHGVNSQIKTIRKLVGMIERDAKRRK